MSPLYRLSDLGDSTVLVTGGAGFIGSELVRQLFSVTKRIYVVDNLVNGRRENLDGILDKKVSLHTIDIRNIDQMQSIVEKVDIIFHLACLGVRHSIHSPIENHTVNSTATLELLELARSCQISRFVYVSSSEVYGTAQSVPINEKHPTSPMTVYGAAKLGGEDYARAYFRTYNYPTVVVRPFNAFGPRCHHQGDSGEVIPRFLLRAMAGKPMVVFGDGTQTRDFTYVTDIARGILSAGFSDQTVGKTINIGQGVETTVNVLAQTIAQILGHNSADIIYEPSRPGDVMRLLADSTKAYQLFSYMPEVSLSKGLQNLKEWYENSGKQPEDLLQEEILHNWKSFS